MDNLQESHSLPQTKSDWWNNNRFKCNKGLAIAGLTTILITAVVFYLSGFYTLREILFIPLIGTAVYLFYMGAVNVILLLLEFADRQIQNNIDIKTREILFRILFCIALALPFLYPAFIISMLYL